jgi:hypothetical protein
MQSPKMLPEVREKSVYGYVHISPVPCTHKSYSVYLCVHDTGDMFTMYGDMFTMYGDMFTMYGDMFTMYGDMFTMYDWCVHDTGDMYNM